VEVDAGRDRLRPLLRRRWPRAPASLTWVSVLLALALFAAPALAENSEALTQTLADPQTLDNPLGPQFVLRSVVALLLVIAMAVLALWWLKRGMAGLPGLSRLRVVAGIPVGIKERVVLLEAEGETFLVGVAPGAVNLLARWPRPQVASDMDAPLPVASGSDSQPGAGE